MGIFSDILNETWLEVTIFVGVWVSKPEDVVWAEILGVEQVANSIVVELIHNFARIVRQVTIFVFFNQILFEGSNESLSFGLVAQNIIGSDANLSEIWGFAEKDFLGCESRVGVLIDYGGTFATQF